MDEPCAVCGVPGVEHLGMVCDFCSDEELLQEPEALPAGYYVESDFLYDCWREKGRF